MNTKKGAAPLFTGMMILVLSVLVMITIIAFVVPYFNTLSDSVRYKNNKENILTINETLLSLNNYSLGTYKEISLYPTDEIEFLSNENKIIIKQNINNSNRFAKTPTEQRLNNLLIKKENNQIIFELDLNNIVTIEDSFIVNKDSRQKIKFEITEIINNIPKISITRTAGRISRVILSPENSTFAGLLTISVITLPTDCNVYYTNDGTIPTTDSNLYTEPITITESSVIKFKAYKQGYEPSLTVTGNYSKIDGVSFYNKYDQENPTLDLSGNNNTVVNKNILFGFNGAYFNRSPENYLLIKNDYNGSNTSLNLGINNFTIEAFVSGGYTGEILSKSGYIGGMDLYVNNNGIVNFSISGYDQLNLPRNIAIDENYIYIADTGFHRIQKRRKDNWQLVAISGGPLAGSSIDQYNSPYSVAVDDQYVYVSDYGNSRINKRNKEDLSYVSMLANGGGSGDTQVRYNWGIAVDDQHIYVTEYSYHRVKKFNKETFAFVAKMPATGTSSGTGNDQFSSPTGIAVDGDYLYIAEYGNHRLKKINKNNLSFVTLIGGTAGSGEDQFYYPYGVAVDDNQVYVASYYNNRIMIRNKEDLTKVTRLLSSGTPNDYEYHYVPWGVAVDENYLYVSENANHRIKKLNKSDYSVASVFSSPFPLDEAILSSYGIANDGEYLYYSDYDIDRVVKRRISDMEVVGIIGGPYPTDTPTMFNNPYGVAVDDQYLYVAEYGSHKIKQYNKDTLTWVSTHATPTDTPAGHPNQLRYPFGIAVDGNYVYVTEYSTNHRLKKINTTTNPWTIEAVIGINATGNGPDRFYNPTAITVDQNYVYVADMTNARIKKHNKSDLSFVSQVGYLSSANMTYGFGSVYGLTNDENYLYISNSAYGTILRYTKDFQYVSAIGTNPGYDKEDFMYPTGITIAGEDMYIIDRTTGKIVKRKMTDFDTNITITGSQKDRDFSKLYYSQAIDSDENYYYVANTQAHRIEKRRKTDFEVVAYSGGPIPFPADGYFATPTDVLVDGNFVYVADSGYHRIVMLNKEDLSYYNKIGGTSSGSTTTTFYYPYGLAIDDQYLYIADHSNNRIVKRDKLTLEYVSMLSNGAGSADNQVRYTYSIAVDDQYLYVAEVSYHRIKKFDKTTFAFVAKTEGTTASSLNERFNSPRGIDVDENYVYIADTGNHRIKKHNKSDLSFVSLIGGVGHDENNFYQPYDIKYKDGILLVTDTYNSRLKLHSTDLSYISEIQKRPNEPEDLFFPTGVAVDENFVYISDSYNNRIVKKNKSDLSYVTEIGTIIPGSGDDQFNTPYGLEVDDQYLYVADYSNSRIKRHNKSDLSFVDKLQPGSGLGVNNITNPFDVAVDDNYLYLIEYANCRLKKINKNTWETIAVTGGPSGNCNISTENFLNPTSVDVNGGFVYVTDYSNHRIKIYDTDLQLISIIGIGGSDNLSAITGSIGEESFNGPYSIKIVGDYIYVSDSSNNRIKVFDSNFNQLYKFSRLGYGDDQLYGPTFVTADSDNVYIVDRTNYRLIKRSIDDLKKLENLPRTNFVEMYATTGNKIISSKRIATDSQIIIRRLDNTFCIYINGKKDNCANLENYPTSLTYPELNYHMFLSTTPQTYYIFQRNPNYYPYGVGNNNLFFPSQGSLKYLRFFNKALTDSEILALYESR